MTPSAGTLSLVSTPIGNLGDITARALEILKNADAIACEDTRHSGRLLSHYGIKSRLLSYHDFNKERITDDIIQKLVDGRNIALITDAGTPGIADPAFYLVRKAIGAGIPVESAPGACAALTALAVSGLPCDRFVFENFPPVKSGKRKNFLESLKDEKRTVILYESPHRIIKLLTDMQAIYGNIHIVVARELTKKFEEVLRDTVENLLMHFEKHPPKGEFVVLFNLKELAA